MEGRSRSLESGRFLTCSRQSRAQPSPRRLGRTLYHVCPCRPPPRTFCVRGLARPRARCGNGSYRPAASCRTPLCWPGCHEPMGCGREALGHLPAAPGRGAVNPWARTRSCGPSSSRAGSGCREPVGADATPSSRVTDPALSARTKPPPPSGTAPVRHRRGRAPSARPGTAPHTTGLSRTSAPASCRRAGVLRQGSGEPAQVLRVPRQTEPQPVRVAREAADQDAGAPETVEHGVRVLCLRQSE